MESALQIFALLRIKRLNAYLDQVDESIINSSSVRQEEGRPRTQIAEEKELLILANFAMITFRCLFNENLERLRRNLVIPCTPSSTCCPGTKFHKPAANYHSLHPPRNMTN
jgi:hypothetical protein